jgi:hypothetical protein
VVVVDDSDIFNGHIALRIGLDPRKPTPLAERYLERIRAKNKADEAAQDIQDFYDAMNKGEVEMNGRRKPILCCDFDGVIHSYTSPWIDEATIPDPPVPGALRWLWKATEWFDVQIYSSRSRTWARCDAQLRITVRLRNRTRSSDVRHGILPNDPSDRLVAESLPRS